MIIHTVNDSETPYSIAREYSVPVTKLLSDNGLTEGRLIPGEELAVIVPTRTVTVRAKDTIPGLAARFRVRPYSILSANPHLRTRKALTPGQLIAIKQSAPSLGCAAAAGYVHEGITADDLTRSLPFITYYVICAAQMRGRCIDLSFDASELARRVRSEGRLPLLYVSDETDGGYLSDKCCSDILIGRLIALASEGGFAGVCLASPYSNDMRFPSFVMSARRGFIGSELIFLTEVKACGAETAELSDGAILSDVFCRDRTVLSAFADTAESSKVFVSLDCECKMGGTPITHADARRICIRDGKRFSLSGGAFRGFSHTVYKGGKGEAVDVTCPSLEYIKAKLVEISELGFMGIAVNVNNVPTAIYSMFNALFSRADHSVL